MDDPVVRPRYHELIDQLINNVGNPNKTEEELGDTIKLVNEEMEIAGMRLRRLQRKMQLEVEIRNIIRDEQDE